MICRIRQSNRFPSDKTMRAIERRYGWPYIEQGLLIQEGGTAYAEEFEKILND